MRALEIHALTHTSQLDVVILLNDFESDLATSITSGVVDFPESTTPESPEDGVPVQWAVAMLVGVLHPNVSLSVSRSLGKKPRAPCLLEVGLVVVAPRDLYHSNRIP